MYISNINNKVYLSILMQHKLTYFLECSGVHRSLGVHYSKVRSLTLDDWEPEILKVLAEVGNSVVNEVYEYNVPNTVTRASAKCHE